MSRNPQSLCDCYSTSGIGAGACIETFAMQMNTTPHSLLVGITRMIAIYFGIRSIDQLTGGIFAYYIQTSMRRSMSPEMPDILPSVFAIYVPAFLLYVTLMVAVWFAAPLICRVAMAGKAVKESDDHNVLGWNSVMIFLVGTLLVGWGLTRLAEDFTPYFQARAKHIEFTLHVGIQIHAVISILLIGFGAIFMSRFAPIYRWIASRAKTPEGEQAVSSDGYKPTSSSTTTDSTAPADAH